MAAVCPPEASLIAPHAALLRGSALLGLQAVTPASDEGEHGTERGF